MSRPAELSLGSFNLHYGVGHRFRGYPPFDPVAACARIDTDVLVLQESWRPDEGRATHELVAEALGYEVAGVQPLGRATRQGTPKVLTRASAPDALDHGEGWWDLVVLTRRPVTAVDHLPLGPPLRLDPADRAVLRVAVDLAGAPFVVCATHLSHLEMGVYRHRADLRAALPADEVPAVLVGDMNMWGWCIDRMAPPTWRRVPGRATFSSLVRHSRIDHLVTSPAARVLDSEVLPHLGSDHLPIRGRLAAR